MGNKPRLSIDIYNQYFKDDNLIEWPDDQKEQALLARALFGRQLIAKFDYWLRHAIDLLENPEPKKPFPRHNIVDLEDHYFRGNMQTLEPNQQKAVRDLIRTTVHGVLFSALIILDQSPFGKYDLRLTPSQTTENSGISLFMDLPDELHDELNDWIISFSDYSDEIVELVQHSQGWWQFQIKESFRS
jgi:hypothetical protein